MSEEASIKVVDFDDFDHSVIWWMIQRYNGIEPAPFISDRPFQIASANGVLIWFVPILSDAVVSSVKKIARDLDAGLVPIVYSWQSVMLDVVVDEDNLRHVNVRSVLH